MQYHPHAPAPAAASTSTKINSKTFFKSTSRTSRACVSFRFLHSLPPVQILLQNQSRSHGVHARLFVFFLSFFVWSSVNRPALVFLEQPLRLPTRQPLVHHLDRQTKLLVHALPEPRCFLSHFPARSIEPQRQSHHNLPHIVLANQLPQPPHVLVPVDAIQGSQRLRQRCIHAGYCHPDSSPAVIQGENACRLGIPWVHVERALTHTSSIPGSNSPEARCCLRVDYLLEHKAPLRLDEKGGLRFSTAGAALPGVPVTEGLQLLVEGGFFDEEVEFAAGKAFAERLCAISNAPGSQSG